MKTGETIANAMTLVSRLFDAGSRGYNICFVSNAALMAASHIPLQHARMLNINTGWRRD